MARIGGSGRLLDDGTSSSTSAAAPVGLRVTLTPATAAAYIKKQVHCSLAARNPRAAAAGTLLHTHTPARPPARRTAGVCVRTGCTDDYFQDVGY